MIRAVGFLIDNRFTTGVYNFCAPGVLRQQEFARALGKALGRPARMPTPALALRLMMGEVADVLMASQRVLPKRLLADGFAFSYPEADSALANLVERS